MGSLRHVEISTTTKECYEIQAWAWFWKSIQRKEEPKLPPLEVHVRIQILFPWPTKLVSLSLSSVYTIKLSKNQKQKEKLSWKKEGIEYHLWHLHLFGVACLHALSSSTQSKLPPMPKLLPSRRKQLPQVAHCVSISYDRLLGKHTQRASIWTQI